MFDDKERKKMQQSIDKLISEKYMLTCKLREYETCGTFKEMRNHIKDLEFAYESHVNDMALLEARIKELEAENEKLEDDWQKSYAEECVTRHENHRLVDRIEELETKLAKEKAYSHSLREELGNYNDLYKH